MEERLLTTLQLRVGTATDLATLVTIDEDASRLFVEAGMVFDAAATASMASAEQARWLRELEQGRVVIAVRDGRDVGFAAMDVLDGDIPFLDQLCVHTSAMRQGFGKALLGEAIAWAGANPHGLWLTTYGHLAWNRPFYEREGFQLVPEHEWGADIRRHNAEERLYLPLPHERVVMRRLRTT